MNRFSGVISVKNEEYIYNIISVGQPKNQVILRIDTDLNEWFRSHGKEYQIECIRIWSHQRIG